MLTPRQQQLLDYLHHHQRTTGVMPSTREIQQHFGFASQTAAVSHLKALERKGAIKKLAGKARALIFPGELGSSALAIPIYGAIPAGMPSNGDPAADGLLSVDTATMSLSRGASVFALKVRGESMTGAHILPGDLAIFEKKDPRDGDIVAALIDGETTLKRFVVKEGQPHLKAENPIYPDLQPVQELVVQGVFMGLVRPSARS